MEKTVGHSRPPGLLRRLAGERRGVVAVEFAMIAVPFFALLLIVMNSALMMLYNAVIQGAVQTVAREIETGQIQYSIACPPSSQADIAAEAAAAAALQQAVCGGSFNMLSCSDPALHIDVRAFTSFGAISLPAPGPSATYCVDTGGAGAIVAVRLIYDWTHIPALAALIGIGGTAQIQYTIFTKNEPF